MAGSVRWVVFLVALSARSSLALPERLEAVAGSVINVRIVFDLEGLLLLAADLGLLEDETRHSADVQELRLLVALNSLLTALRVGAADQAVGANDLRARGY